MIRRRVLYESEQQKLLLTQRNLVQQYEFIRESVQRSGGSLDLTPDLIRDLHRVLMQDLYSFAGSFRDRPRCPTLRADLWDLCQLRLRSNKSKALADRKRLPRHRPGDPFIKGPIPYSRIASACRLPGSGLQVAMDYRFLCCRFKGSNRWEPTKILKGLRISDDSVRGRLRSAELAGLLSASRERGCKLVNSILDLPEANHRPKHRPFYGPIPWSWWLPASRLPRKSLQVGANCWLLAGWDRSAEFELALNGWSEFGLSRFSASRGVVELERAELITVAHFRGRSPIIILRGRHLRGSRYRINTSDSPWPSTNRTACPTRARRPASGSSSGPSSTSTSASASRVASPPRTSSATGASSG
jgi:hypothetical protein